MAPSTSLKNFAEAARQELHVAVETQLLFYGLPDSDADPFWDRHTLEQRNKLALRLQQKGRARVIEEAAYTWFNRLCALRLMEVRGYLPRCLSSSVTGRSQPDLLQERDRRAFELGLAAIPSGSDEAIYRKLLLAQCNQLHQDFPFLFEALGSEDELLLPANLLNANSIRGHLLQVEEDAWQEVEVIGWLYQYYIAAKKAEVIGKVVKKADIPAATQLFTPRWIVDYMVQNSLGALWLESWPQSGLRQHMPYFIELGEQDAAVLQQLEALRIAHLDPTSIKVLDPACGSGHILVRAFDLLYEIYLEQGYPSRDIGLAILKNNLFGLDIDARAAQMAGLALMIKGRERDPRFFERLRQAGLEPHIAVVGESQGAVEVGDAALQPVAGSLVACFADAGNLGSLIEIPPEISSADLQHLQEHLQNAQGDLFGNEALTALKALLPAAKILRETYEVVVANPPFMGGKYLNNDLKNYIKARFPNSKSDLYSVFAEKITELTKSTGILGLMTPFTWMFLSSHESFRQEILKNHTLKSLVRPSYTAFFQSAIVPICSFIIQKKHIEGINSAFFDLGYLGNAEEQPIRMKEAIQNPDCGWFYRAKPDDFAAIPGSPIAYWASERMRQIFREGTPLGEIASPRQGMATSNNNRFLRRWWEVAHHNIGFGMKSRDEAQASRMRWFPYNKGGAFRKWYGNNEWVVNWEDDGREVLGLAKDLYGSPTRTIKNISHYFKPGITWSFVSSSYFGVRWFGPGFVFDVGGSSAFPPEKDTLEITAFLCTAIAFEFMKCLNPTLNFQVGNVAALPYPGTLESSTRLELKQQAEKCIEISKWDWDSYERSWDFKSLFSLNESSEPNSLVKTYSDFERRKIFQKEILLKTESAISNSFGDIFNIENRVDISELEKQLTLTDCDKISYIGHFLSYALGCMMGRYSLDEPGLIHAGQAFDASRHTTFPADDDGIVPILEENWFEDDVVHRLVEFVRCIYGDAGLAPSLEFLAEALGGKSGITPEATLRKYFVKDFIKDHIQTYKKRPIYWLFSSHPKNRSGGAFQALVYLHRYQPNTLATLRTKYLRRYQEALVREIQVLTNPTSGESSVAQVQREKQLANYRAKLEEVRAYDEKLKHFADMRIELDLDDGVAYNYTRFADIIYWGPELKEKDLRQAAQWKEDLLKGVES